MGLCQFRRGAWWLTGLCWVCWVLIRDGFDGFDSVNLGLSIQAWWWSRGFVPISAWCVVVDGFEMGFD